MTNNSKKIVSFIITLFFLLGLAFWQPRLVLACDWGACSASQRCDSICSDCPWCTPQKEKTEIYNPALKEGIRNLLGVDFFNLLLPNLITLGLAIAAITTLFFLLLGGIKWITSSGDKEKLDQAKRTITAAIVGLVLVLSLWAILQLLESLFGINLTVIDLGPIMLK